MPRLEPREKMSTPGGNSIRNEIEARLEAARSLAFEEAIAFLRMAGHGAAANDLEQAAFTPQEPSQ